MTMRVCKYTHVRSRDSVGHRQVTLAELDVALYLAHLPTQRRTKPTNVHKVRARPGAAEVSRAV